MKFMKPTRIDIHAIKLKEYKIDNNVSSELHNGSCVPCHHYTSFS